MHFLLYGGIKIHAIDSHAGIGAKAKHMTRLTNLSLAQGGQPQCNQKKDYSLILHV